MSVTRPSAGIVPASISLRRLESWCRNTMFGLSPVLNLPRSRHGFTVGTANGGRFDFGRVLMMAAFQFRQAVTEAGARPDAICSKTLRDYGMRGYYISGEGEAL